MTDYAKSIPVSNVFTKTYDAEQVTLRDQFAMAALTGLLAALTHGSPADHIAKQAYAAADAMLEARKEKK